MKKQTSINRIAVIGNYLPRQCGIATFTTDLCEALATEYKNLNIFAVPINDTEEGYAYPDRVRFEISEQQISSYQRAANFLNVTDVDLVCLQHEYGIFGGGSGSHILALLRELRMPVFTTLHTVLEDPSPRQHAVMVELADLSDRLIVMSQHSAKSLQEIYKIPKEKIDFIPHGIPDVSFMDPNYYKDLFHVEGKTVLLTFGLLSPNKGIENVIEALPAVLKRYPDVVYLVLGTTHPNVKRNEGEAYRLSLTRLAQSLGVEKNVIFHNQFVGLDELVKYIGAADIYITPYLNPKQTVSGTLAYTVGAGKAIISTPYWYAEELLADGRGLLIPFGDPTATAASILEVLDNESKRHAMRKCSYEFGREMTWPKVARQYMESFLRAREDRARHPRPVASSKPAYKAARDLPALNLDHLQRMTDGTGILQHAIFSVPNYTEGYTTDDNARALALAIQLEETTFDKKTTYELATQYLSFLGYAFNAKRKRFRNFLSYDRRWLEEIGSEDSHGRSLWGLGTVLGRSGHSGLRGLANQLFHLALPSVTELTSPRSWAFAIFGIQEYLKEFPGDRTVQQLRKILAMRLKDCYQNYHRAEWPWFEDSLTYCNAVLPHALLLCGDSMGDHDLTTIGLKALEWLTQLQKNGGDHFVPIGSSGFYQHGKEKARFDQQPVESQAMISACLAAYRITHDEHWRKDAQLIFNWYLGVNDLQIPLYDAATGGCKDGLHSDRVNQNQGAESVLSFLISLVEMRAVEYLEDSTRNLLELVAITK